MVARPVLEKTDQLTALAVGQEQHWSQQVDVTFIITGSRKPLTKHAHTSGRYVAQKAPGQDLSRFAQPGGSCMLSAMPFRHPSQGSNVGACLWQQKGCIMLRHIIQLYIACSILGKIMYNTFIFRPTGQQHQNISTCFSWASNIILFWGSWCWPFILRYTHSLLAKWCDGWRQQDTSAEPGGAA